jgi:hypothetical protein
MAVKIRTCKKTKFTPVRMICSLRNAFSRGSVNFIYFRTLNRKSVQGTRSAIQDFVASAVMPGSRDGKAVGKTGPEAAGNADFMRKYREKRTFYRIRRRRGGSGGSGVRPPAEGDIPVFEKCEKYCKVLASAVGNP